jgi:dipeptidyl aminopeptidase/acylaminoacyl peptidase
MTRDRRILFLAAGVVVLVLAAAAAVGIALAVSDDDDGPERPGRIAVRHQCGILHMWEDGTDQRSMCLDQVFDTVSLSWNGEKLAWDTRAGEAIMIGNADGSQPVASPLPTGKNDIPSLSPDGEKLAFLHSARDDGLYDIWVGSTTADDAEQLTSSRNVSDVTWSPKGDLLAYVQNWSEQTLEGQVSLIRPDGEDARTLVDGDAPTWSPDGKTLAYVHDRDIWTVGADGSGARKIVEDGHSPAWSRDGTLIAFMRAEKCGRAVCPERVFLVFRDGTRPRQVGPRFADERRLLWLPDPNE